MDVLGTYIAAPDPATGEKNACGVRLTNEMAPVLGLLLQMNYTAAVEALVNKIVRAPEGGWRPGQCCVGCTRLHVQELV
jgi:hypothetical protein